MEAASLFTKYTDAGVLNRAEKYSFWTDASLFPKDSGSTVQSSTALARDWQSLGVELVNYVAGKLAQELFPIDKAFFRLVQHDQKPKSVFDQQAADDAEVALGGVETRACNRLLWNGNYSRLLRAVRLLVVTGNALVVREGDTFYSYSARNYVVRRDGAGQPLLVILKERKCRSLLPDNIQKQLTKPAGPSTADDDVEFYTVWRWVRSGTDLKVQMQQACDSWISDPITTDSDSCGVLPLYWDLVPGEHFGRGLVEAFSGDFAKYSALSEALALYETAMCKEVVGVAPGSGSDLDALNEASVGEFVQADPNSVGAIEFGNANKAQALQAELQALEARMKRSFGFQSAVRDSERTTALEVSIGAKESDVVFGGTYSQLSHNIQIPLAYLLVMAEDTETFGKLKAKTAKLELITGVPALGRAARVQAMLRAAQSANVIAQAVCSLSQKYSPERIVDLCLQSEGVDPHTVSRTEQELMQQQQQAAPLNPSDPNTLQQAMQGVLNG